MNNLIVAFCCFEVKALEIPSILKDFPLISAELPRLVPQLYLPGSGLLTHLMVCKSQT